MENLNERVEEPGRGPFGQQQYVPVGLPKREYAAQDPRHKSPVLAAVMSLLPGIGQTYVGYYQQGFINIVVIAGLITALAYRGISDDIKPFLAIFMAFYWFYNMVDAYRKAIFYNQVLAGIGALEMPDGEQLPGLRGSLFGGVVMIIAGAIAISYTVFGIPMGWLNRWWPMALILFGALLLYQSIAAKRKAQKP
jgi:hypothetical protein